MIDFAQLTTTAVLGTRTRPVAATDIPDALAEAVGAGADATAVLLDAAGAWSALRRGALPPGPPVPPLDLPAAAWPLAPAEALALLHRIRSTGSALRERLQHEALEALGARHLTLPHDLLLPLLAEASTRPDVARDVAGVLDRRGRALVALDPVWSAALARAGAGADDDRDLWREGTDAQRAAHLAALRRRDPDAGRTLLEDAGFAREAPDVRELLVRQLRIGLAPADEPFLESRLDDRASAVRRTAGSLLAVLPGSAYARRAEAIAAAHVRPTRRALTEVDAVGVTPATLRDGYPDRDATGTPPGLLHLQEVVGLVDPRRWPALVGASAVDLARSPARHRGEPIDLRGAFLAAAIRWEDADLAEALVRADPPVLARVVGLLRPDVREHALLAALDGPPQADLLAAAMQPPMGARVSVAAADALRRLATARDQLHRAVGLLPTLALHADPLAAPAVLDRLRAWEAALGRELAPALRRELAAAAAALQLRQALAEALLAHPIVDPTRMRKG